MSWFWYFSPYTAHQRTILNGLEGNTYFIDCAARLQSGLQSRPVYPHRGYSIFTAGHVHRQEKAARPLEGGFARWGLRGLYGLFGGAGVVKDGVDKVGVEFRFSSVVKDYNRLTSTISPCSISTKIL